ncbi:MAG: hypothetical protein WAL34_15470 [Acidobacteriaceae bacterium]
MRSMAELAAIFLAPKDRDAVLGDLAEACASGWSAPGPVLGLVVRQQMELWRAWQPWVASGVASAGSLLLLSASFGLSMDSRQLLRGERGYGSVLCEALLDAGVGVDERIHGGVALREDAMGERHSGRDPVSLLRRALP